MIRRREFRIPSSDGKSELHTVLWEPDGEVKQLLLISHGMMPSPFSWQSRELR